ncbi:MAG: hypothetical protein WC829_05900 [Hyphomicrobium sp.]|jgi:hypothetical protein
MDKVADKVADAVITPWIQTGIIGSVVLALAVVVIILWRRDIAASKAYAADMREMSEARLKEVRECGAQYLETTKQLMMSNNKLADSLEGLERIVESALVRLK